MTNNLDPIVWPDDPYLTDGGEWKPPVKAQTGRYAKTEKFPCTGCGGTGRWVGGVNCYGNSACRACGGKGYFLTSEADRAKARISKRVSKARHVVETKARFTEEHAELIAFLTKAAGWSSFAASLLDDVQREGPLTPAQVDGANRMRAKCEARAAERAKEREAGRAQVDLAAIRTMFETAVGNGYKKPVYRAAGLKISRAPDTGRNPGALYVVAIETDKYLGKIIGTEYSGKPAPGLAEIAADPRAAAVAYGRRTGTCSCCGAELTNTKSIELGIGPICRARWGL